jgi:hypothetical protein
MSGGNPTAGPETMSFGGSGGGLPEGLELPEGVELPEGLGQGGSGTPGGSSGEPPEGMPSGAPTDMPGAPGAGGFGSFGGGTTLTSDQRKILDYATEHSGDARITLAVEGGSMGSATFILNSDATVIGMGVFSGSDNAPSVQQLRKWTKSGELRYVLGSDSGSSGGLGALMGGADSAASQRSTWISENCTKVPAKEYGGSTSDAGGGDSAAGGMMGLTATTLYDCAASSTIQ